MTASNGRPRFRDPAQGGDGDPADGGLVLRGVSVHFGGITALSEVSLDVPSGQVTGLIGPNGSGKTTLFNVVCGFVQPHRGTMEWRGRPLHPRPHRLTRMGIARTIQSVGLFSGLTVVENVMAAADHTARTGFLAALFALPRSDRQEEHLRSAALATLERLDMTQYADTQPASLPFALRKRVALARALAGRPSLLLLDEPAAGIGTKDIADLTTLLRSLPGEGTTVLLVEHRMDFVMEVCDTVAVLDFGRLIDHGSPEHIRASQTVADAYLGAEPADGDAFRDGDQGAPG